MRRAVAIGAALQQYDLQIHLTTYAAGQAMFFRDTGSQTID